MKKTIRNFIIAFVMAASGANLFAATAYMLMANGLLYEEKDGKMAQAAKLSTGTSLETLGGEEKDGKVQVSYQGKSSGQTRTKSLPSRTEQWPSS